MAITFTELSTTGYVTRQEPGKDEPTLIAVPTTFRYSDSDPFVLMVTFHVPDAPAVWEFARDLLDSIISEHDDNIVYGDVWGSVDRDQDTLYIGLSAGEGRDIPALIQFRLSTIKQFLRDSYMIVGRGDEIVDVDATLAKLLA
jgi:hypothetical protein